MNTTEKIKLALNTLENVVPKNYDPQEAFDVDDLLTVILSRVDLSKRFLTEALAAIEAEKPVEDIEREISELTETLEGWERARWSKRHIANDLVRFTGIRGIANCETYHVKRCEDCKEK